MKLYILGTGNALVTECYNTCFVVENDGRFLLVDGGGGSAVLTQLKRVGVEIPQIHDIFVTHKHIDHLLGIIWMIRIIAQSMNKGQYEGDAYIYGHDEVVALLRELAVKLLQGKETRLLDERIHLVEVQDGQNIDVIGCKCTAFDIQSTKAKQFGFCMYYGDGQKLCCCGDEPFNECELEYASGSDWMLHEAFCLYGEADKFKPYEKHHSTVKDACELAEKLGVKNLLLYHTEDKNILKREQLYRAEGEQYYKGKLWIPNDLDVIEF